MKSQILTDNGCDIETLDRDGTVEADPALENVKDEIAGALYAEQRRERRLPAVRPQYGKWLENAASRSSSAPTSTGFDMPKAMRSRRWSPTRGE